LQAFDITLGFLSERLTGKQKGTAANDSAYPFRAQQCTPGPPLWHMKNMARASTVWTLLISIMCSP